MQAGPPSCELAWPAFPHFLKAATRRLLREAFDLCSGRSGLSELDVVVERSGVRNHGGAEGRPLVEVVGG